MKVIKIVGEGSDALHYVEGGPVCEGCEGNGYVGYTVNRFPHDACHGTGLIPVELWPDAELDRFLNTHFETWDLRMRRELHTNEPIYQVEGEPWTLNFPCAETSRGAKIAAVIAVAEDAK